MEYNKMLVNAAEEGGLRVAVLQADASKNASENNTLCGLYITHPGTEQKKSNIYKGCISRIEPSLGAAFVDYGAERHGFLPLKEVSKNYFLPGFSGDFSTVNIKDVLREGQELIVQVEKEERGNKGAALTTFISFAGSYVVLMPNNPRAGGISRRIEGEKRDELREAIGKLNLPNDMGVIVRTAGIGRTVEELQWDLEMLLQLWSAIVQASATRPAPFLIYQENDTAICAVRDYLRENLSEIIVDNYEVAEKIKNYVQLIRPDFANRVKFYNEKIPLFSRYHIEKQIEMVHQRVVRLPSGGAIVFDYTEALISIDVNSARSTSGSGIEETALNTNIEAAEEIARQLYLRDVGGLIVIDFIDMDVPHNQREVYQRLRHAFKHDRARVQIGSISRFGLLEMSRQRLRPHIGEAIQITCPRCDGQGTIRSIESLANSIVHLIEEESTKENIGEIHVQVPTDLATYLLNEKRSSLDKIETIQKVRVLVLPNQHLETPKFRIKSVKVNESTSGAATTSVMLHTDRGAKSTTLSYKLLDIPDTATPQKQILSEQAQEVPAVATTFIPTAASTIATSAHTSRGIKGKDSESFAANKTSLTTKKYDSSIFRKLSHALKNVFHKNKSAKTDIQEKDESNNFKKRSGTNTNASSNYNVGNENKRSHQRRRPTSITATNVKKNTSRSNSSKYKQNTYAGSNQSNDSVGSNTNINTASINSNQNDINASADITAIVDSGKKFGSYAAPSAAAISAGSNKRQVGDNATQIQKNKELYIKQIYPPLSPQQSSQLQFSHTTLAPNQNSAISPISSIPSATRNVLSDSKQDAALLYNNKTTMPYSQKSQHSEAPSTIPIALASQSTLQSALPLRPQTILSSQQQSLMQAAPLQQAPQKNQSTLSHITNTSILSSTDGATISQQTTKTTEANINMEMASSIKPEAEQLLQQSNTTKNTSSATTASPTVSTAKTLLTEIVNESQVKAAPESKLKSTDENISKEQTNNKEQVNDDTADKTTDRG